MEDSEKEQKAWELLEDYASRYRPEWKDSMLLHAGIVLDLSSFIAGLIDEDIDMETIRLGAVLHDIGRTRAERVVEHGVRSGEIMRKEGYPEEVARICETHVGVGITLEEAQKLGLGDRNMVPETLEEKIVCYADNLLFYLKDEDRHEIGDREAVVKRFEAELGKEYGERVRRFMATVESLIGDRMEELRDFIRNYNETLSREGR